MKKIIKYFAMFLLILAIVISASGLSVNAEEPINESETSEIEDIINDNSPLTDEQIAWVKQYLSQYVDENVIEVIITVLSALSFLAVLTISLVKLVKTVNGGLKKRTDETTTFNELAQTNNTKLGVIEEKLESTINVLTNNLDKQVEANKHNTLIIAKQNEKLDILAGKISNIINDVEQGHIKSTELVARLNEMINNQGV